MEKALHEAKVHTSWINPNTAYDNAVHQYIANILDPERMNAILDVPGAWQLIGYFCLGYPEAESDEPELERSGWEVIYGLALGRPLRPAETNPTLQVEQDG